MSLVLEFGVCHFTSALNALRAIRILHGMKVMENKLKVTLVDPKNKDVMDAFVGK